MNFSSTLQSRFDAGANNFDTIRLVAALLVLFGHAYSLAGVPADPISNLVALGYIGTLAVAVFFVLSGFLIARSVERSTLSSYLAARVLRIIPALALVTTLEAWVLGPYFFEADVPWYLQTLAPAHMKNVLVFGLDPWIAGVFTHNPVPFVNGSLWTLPVEALFYLLLPFLMLLAMRRRWVILMLWLTSLAAEPVAVWYGLNGAALGGLLFNAVRVFPTIQMAGYFLAGVVAWLYRDQVPWDRGVFLATVILLFAARGGMAVPLVLKLCLPYAVLYAGIAGGFGSRLKARIGDLSYGVYLFGFPVLGSIVALGHQTLSPQALFGIALPVTLVFAMLSWHLVENPALQLRRRMRLRENRRISLATPSE
jgi:peptidoglycan/LPS O-acetylase OafA/YrhL